MLNMEIRQKRVFMDPLKISFRMQRHAETGVPNRESTYIQSRPYVTLTIFCSHSFEHIDKKDTLRCLWFEIVELNLHPTGI